MAYQIDIDVDDFLDSCSKYEIYDVIDWLDTEGYIRKKDGEVDTDNNSQNFLDYEWDTIVTTLSQKRLSLTSDEEAIIKNIVKRFI
jgi:hypothetical protein